MEAELGNDHNSSEKKWMEELPLSDGCFDAYRNANLIFPQRSLGITILTAAAALSDPAFDPMKFERMIWSKEQLNIIISNMNRAHAAHGIRSGTRDAQENIEKGLQEHGKPAAQFQETPRDSLEFLWLRFKKDILKMISISLDDVTDAQSDDIPDNRTLATRISRAFEHHGVRMRVVTMFNSFAKTLSTQWALNIAKAIQSSITQGKSYDELYDQLYERMISNYETEGGHLSYETKDKLWAFLGSS